MGKLGSVVTSVAFYFFVGIASMQKIEIFRFMRFSERFQHSFIGFGADPTRGLRVETVSKP